MADHYTVLGCTRYSTPSEVKRSYHQLALRFHPDKNPSGAATFKLVCTAYQVLSDPTQRMRYDQTLPSGAHHRGRPPASPSRAAHNPSSGMAPSPTAAAAPSTAWRPSSAGLYRSRNAPAAANKRKSPTKEERLSQDEVEQLRNLRSKHEAARHRSHPGSGGKASAAEPTPAGSAAFAAGPLRHTRSGWGHIPSASDSNPDEPRGSAHSQSPPEKQESDAAAPAPPPRPPSARRATDAGETPSTSTLGEMLAALRKQKEAAAAAEASPATRSTIGGAATANRPASAGPHRRPPSATASSSARGGSTGTPTSGTPSGDLTAGSFTARPSSASGTRLPAAEPAFTTTPTPVAPSPPAPSRPPTARPAPSPPSSAGQHDDPPKEQQPAARPSATADTLPSARPPPLRSVLRPSSASSPVASPPHSPSARDERIAAFTRRYNSSAATSGRTPIPEPKPATQTRVRFRDADGGCTSPRGEPVVTPAGLASSGELPKRMAPAADLLSSEEEEEAAEASRSPPGLRPFSAPLRRRWDEERLAAVREATRATSASFEDGADPASVSIPPAEDASTTCRNSVSPTNPDASDGDLLPVRRGLKIRRGRTSASTSPAPTPAFAPAASLSPPSSGLTPPPSSATPLDPRIRQTGGVAPQTQAFEVPSHDTIAALSADDARALVAALEQKIRVARQTVLVRSLDSTRNGSKR